MPSWNDIPYSSPLGHGIVLMDIAPDDGCMQCGHWKWALALVNTSLRCDLLTNKPIKTWSVKSECHKCGITTIWNCDPDRTYPRATDDPFAK
jgi:hypothetical protein